MRESCRPHSNLSGREGAKISLRGTREARRTGGRDPALCRLAGGGVEEGVTIEPTRSVGLRPLDDLVKAEAVNLLLVDAAIDVVVKLSPEPGPGLERRRLEIDVPNPPTAGTQVKLSVAPQALWCLWR